MNRAIARVVEVKDHDLPGFDNEQYLEVNGDLVAAGLNDGASHYSQYGQKELRRLFRPGQGLNHPASRMLGSAQRGDWISAVEALCRRREITEVLAEHPRAAWLRTGFTLAGYLQERGDVATALLGDDLRKAAFHFLEFGLEEGATGLPTDWDEEFVAGRYGLSSVKDRPDLRAVLAAVVDLESDPLEIVLNESQQWDIDGFPGALMSENFDHEYYHAMASRAGLMPKGYARGICIEHFKKVGVREMLPIHPDMAFDADFYASELEQAQRKESLSAPGRTEAWPLNASHGPISPPALYLHWLTVGQRKQLAPNLRVCAKRLCGFDIPPALLTQLPIFRLGAGLGRDAAPRRIVWELIHAPLPGVASLELTSDDAVEALVSIADRLVVSGEVSQGEQLYWHVLDRKPGHNRASRHLADLLQRAKRNDVATTLRGQIPEQHSTGWNRLNLAELYLTSGRFEDAAALLSGIPNTALSVVSIASRKRQLAHMLFNRIWDNLADHVAAYGIARTQEQLRGALRACTPTFSTADCSREVRHVALIGNEDLPQCKLYRIDQKAEQLRTAGFEVTIFSPNRDLDLFAAQMDSFEAVIFFRVPAFPKMIDTITAAAQRGLLTFYEIDDVVFDTAHFPPSLESYAGQIDEAHYASMACGVPLFEHAMSLCDYGIASTATIAKMMKDRVRTGQVFEHHNAIGRLHEAGIKAARLTLPERAANAPLVLFYGSGTRAHKEDFHDILEPALAEIVRRYPGRVEIRLVGHFGKFSHLDLARDPVTILEPVWDFEEYYGLLAQADINLSVLTESLLTDAKSEIKWMEAALFGIPSVLSATATHREVVVDNETGLLCRNAAEFTAALDRLVKDRDLRMRIGNAARQVATRTYSLAAMGGNLRQMFDTLRPAGVTKKKLLVVNVFYPPQAIGGATRVVHDNVTLLRERYGQEYEIDVICTIEGGQVPLSVTSYAEDGVRVWGITAVPADGGDMATQQPQMAAAFDRLVEQIKPDLVHFHCVQRLTAAAVDVVRLRAIPYVITLHDGWWISPNQFIIDGKGKAAFYDYSKRNGPDFPDRARSLLRPLTGAARLLAVSESFAELHRQANLPNVVTVENGVSPIATRPSVPSRSGKVRLAHIGGATRHKGLHLVRNALMANDYRNLELLLIDHSLPFGAQVHETWGTTSVLRAGKVPQSQIAELYANVDVLLAPSTWPESYGLVTREAMASGVWVIASDIGAIGGDITEGVDGFRVDISNYQALADCLWRIDGDPSRFLAAPAESPSLRTATDQVDDLVRIYEDVLAEAE
uniref:glycosyltransferase n=1 Tax=uncultured Paracoccus sp. TaxID=189685 RepID=UPI00351A6F7B